LDTDGWMVQGHPIRTIENPVPLIPRGSFPEQVEDPRRNWQMQVHLETRPLNGRSSSSS